MHWNVSEGNIDVLRGFEEDNVNLLTTVQFYKEKIDSVKKNFQNLFEDQRRYEKYIDPLDGKEWKKFNYQERMQERDLTQPEPPDFEETMIIDTIRAMRKDKKEKAKRNMQS